jgi:hypothetical protein
MNNLSIDKAVLEKFGPHTLIAGILLIMLGTAGIVLPSVMSLSAVLIVGWLLLLGGILWAFMWVSACCSTAGRWLPLAGHCARKNNLAQNIKLPQSISIPGNVISNHNEFNPGTFCCCCSYLGWHITRAKQSLQILINETKGGSQ